MPTATTTKNCAVCDGPVDLTDMHPDSSAIPSDPNEQFAAMHTSCANAEDGAADFDADDNRAWIKIY